MMLCAIWYHLYNFKNAKNTHKGVLLLVKLQAEACNFTKSKTPPRMFFTFLKLYKWYQIAQNISNKGQFPLKKFFCGNLSEAISLVKIDVNFKVTSISANKITSFRFPGKIF